MYQGINQCVIRVMEINENHDSGNFREHTPGIVTGGHIRNIRLFLTGKFSRKFPGKIRILVITDYQNRKEDVSIHINTIVKHRHL